MYAVGLDVDCQTHDSSYMYMHYMYMYMFDDVYVYTYMWTGETSVDTPHHRGRDVST